MSPVEATVRVAGNIHDVWEFLTSPLGKVLLVGAVVLAVVGTRGRFLLWVLRWLFGLSPIPSEYDPTFFFDARPTEAALGRPRSRAPRTRWGRMAGYKKMPARLGGVAAVVVTLMAPLAVFTIVGVVLALAGVVVGRHLFRSALYNDIVKDLAVAAETVGWRGEDGKLPSWRTWLDLPMIRWRLTTPLVVPEGAPKWLQQWGSRRWVVRVLSVLRLAYPRVPLDDPAAEVRLHYPRARQVTEAHRSQAADYVTARLPGEWEVEWQDSKQVGIFTHPPSPPTYVGYDPTETSHYGVFDVPIGKTKRHEWFTIPLARLAPHTMLSAPTGYAKTSTLQCFIAHVASRGARVIILDPKRRSFLKAFRDVPGITILTDPASQAMGLEAFAAEMEWRYQMMETYPNLDIEGAEELARFFTPWFLIVDEKATLTQDFKREWKKAGGKGKPAQIETEERVLNLARAALMHVVNASQQGNLETFGSSANRDNHMCRIAAGPQGGQAWRMMFPGQPRQKILAKKGRAIIAVGYEDLEEIQLRHSERDVARAEALAGVAVRERDEEERTRRFEEATGVSMEEAGRPVPYLPGAGETTISVPGQRDTISPADPYGPFGVLDEVPADADPRQLTPLSAGTDRAPETFVEAPGNGSEAAEWVIGINSAAEYLEMTESAFRKARQRTPGGRIPGEEKEGSQVKFRTVDLREWHSQRPVAGGRR